MDLKMANNETKSRSQTEEYWSEHFLSKFGLEYIKHNVLNKRSYKKKDTILKDFDLQMPSKEGCTSIQPSYPRRSSRTAISLTQAPVEKQLQLSESELSDEETRQLEVKAIHKIAQVLHIEADEKNITDMCIQFRREILLLLRRVVRQCFLIGWDMKIKWQLDFALLLMPPWLRTVEMELMMLPQAVVTESAMLSAETTLTTKFKALLEEGGSLKFSRWDTFDANDFKKVSAYYNITMTEARDVWSAMCSKTRQRIIQEAQCQEGSREINFELTDLLLLHDLSFNIVTSESLLKPKQLQKLTALYQCVLKKDVENVLRNERPRLLEVWLQVLAMYPFSLGFSSLVYIQRQWYELKQLARSEVLAFHLQHSHTPPHPLLLSIVANFRHIVQEPLPKWSDFVTSKMVVKFKDISKTVSKKVLEESMDVLNNAREQAEKENNYLDVQNHICIVQPLNSNKYINENNKTELDNAESNKLTENKISDINLINNRNIIDKESQSINKSDLITHNVDKQTINNNEFLLNVNSSVAIKKNLDNKNSLITNNTIECNEIDLNAVLNNIDPTKVKKHLIFDSDSDSETLSVVSQMEYTNNIKTDKQTYFETELNSGISQNNKYSKVINWIDENDGNSKLFKENFVSKMDKNIENDPKLTKKITIPLIRCDEISSWKKYNTNHSINIKLLKNKLCPLKNINNKINTSKILPRRQTRNSCKSFSSNTYLSINLDGLTENFLRNDKNQHLFKLCKQLTVNLHRMKIEPRTMCRRRKKIQLADIEEVRKINSTILTAEVAPVSISRCDSPSEADSFGIFSEEPIREITNYNIIDALELDELFKKLPVPPLTPINLDEPMETATNISTTVLCHIDSEQNKMNKSNNKGGESYDDLYDKILSIIKKNPVHNQAKLPVNVTIRDSSDSDDNVRLNAVIDMMDEKRKKRQNRENNTQNQSKKKRKRKPKRDDIERTETECTNALEEWGRQKNLTKKYFDLPNIVTKSSNGSAIQKKSTKADNTYTNISKCVTSRNANKPTLPTIKPSPVIDLTDGPDDTELDQNSDNTPKIINVCSLATNTDKQDKVIQPTEVITPFLVPNNNINMINTDLATLATPQVGIVGSQQVENIPQVNTLVPVNVAGQQIFVQQSAQAQYTSETAGRSFVIIPKSQLMNGNTSLLLPNLKIVNASLTCNPVDHIQRMMVPNDTQVIESAPHPLLLMPFVPLDLWVQGKSVKELVILQVDVSKPSWTLTDGQTLVTLTDYTCESPIYCSLPSQPKTRIMFPQEKNGTDVYNPPTLQIYEDAAIGTTPFAKWVKSVIDNTEYDFIDNCTNDSNLPETQTRDDDKCEIDRPVSRIKVKSFARLSEMQDGSFIAPERVCLQDRLYMKVSEQPLKYAKVITALPNFEELHNLVLENTPLKLLSKDVTCFDSLQSVNHH